MPLASVTSHWLNGWGEQQDADAAAHTGGYGRPLPRRRRPAKKRVEFLLPIEIVPAKPVEVVAEFSVAELLQLIDDEEVLFVALL